MGLAVGPGIREVIRSELGLRQEIVPRRPTLAIFDRVRGARRATEAGEAHSPNSLLCPMSMLLRRVVNKWRGKP